MPRGLGLATATTSAAFFPHCEQRRRGATALSVVDQPARRAGASRSISRTAAVVELLDVSEHPHPRML